jgi:phosphoribosylamine--glycine ligase
MGLTVPARRLRAGVIGMDGRTSAIRRLLERSHRINDVVVLSSGKGERSVDEAIEASRIHRPDFVVVGPEEPLDCRVVDRLQSEVGIPCVGPTKSLARLESSKSFTRRLLAKYRIPGNPQFEVFEESHNILGYVESLGEFVVKPDGLTGGKGVRVSGVHLHSTREAVDYCNELFEAGEERVVIEERLDGEEFSLQSFCDGSDVRHMPPVQDHKRAYEGDSGPNTGGMGSYSGPNCTLPFLDPQSLAAAEETNKAVARALFAETGEKYKGILFGGFMLTKDGIRLLEYNARFGDPEALNVLSLLETDFADICTAIIAETLDTVPITFMNSATVCKYVVPIGYPSKPSAGERLDMSMVPEESDELRTYYAAVAKRHDGLYLTGSRAIAFVGVAPTLRKAEQIAERAADSVHGPVRHRHDIGTQALIDQRVEHVRRLRNTAGAAVHGGNAS